MPGSATESFTGRGVIWERCRTPMPHILSETYLCAAFALRRRASATTRLDYGATTLSNLKGAMTTTSTKSSGFCAISELT